MKRLLLIVAISSVTMLVADDPVFYFKNELKSPAGVVKNITIKDKNDRVQYNQDVNIGSGSSITSDSVYPSDFAEISIVYCTGNQVCKRYEAIFTNIDKNTKKFYLKFTNKEGDIPVLEPQKGRFFGTRTTDEGLLGQYSLSGNVKKEQITKKGIFNVK